MKAAASLTLACVSALMLAVTVHAQPSRNATMTTCSPLTGLHWTVKGNPTTSGNRYIVKQQGFGCARARALVPGLIKQKGGTPGSVLKGPAGYRCISLIGGNNPNAIAGACYRPGGHSFGWAPKVQRT